MAALNRYWKFILTVALGGIIGTLIPCEDNIRCVISYISIFLFIMFSGYILFFIDKYNGDKKIFIFELLFISMNITCFLRFYSAQAIWVYDPIVAGILLLLTICVVSPLEGITTVISCGVWKYFILKYMSIDEE